jgi:hypothetical protein
MTGDDRVRFCNACNLNVYNFASMTSKEVRSLITNGRVCGRLYRRVDGTLITRDCPVGLRANESDKSERTTKSDDSGVFTFPGVNDGTYTVTISAAGFKTFSIKKVQLSSDESTRAGIHLAFGEVITLTGVVALAPESEIEYTNGTMIIRGDAIRKLPIP